MNTYELTIVMDGAATNAQRKEKREFVEKLVKLHEGKVLSHEDWGVKKLTYVIKKSDTGTFDYFDLELPATALRDVNEKLRLEDGIIRYLVIKKEK